MKIVLHGKIKDGAISLEPHQRFRLLDWLNKYKATEYRLVVETSRGNKTRKALGYYWGGVLPAIVAHNKGLVHEGEIKNNPLILNDLLRSKLIKKTEVDDLHRSIMYTFRPEIVTDLKNGAKCRVGQEMKNYDNEDLYLLTDEIIAYFEPQGYEFPDSERYLEVINSM